MRTNIILPLAILIGGAIVAAAVYMTTAAHTQAVNHPEIMTPVTTADHILGNPDAPVKIVEYSDFDCHYCGEFQQTLTRIMNDYGPTGNVAWVFREFPLTEIHPNAFKTAEAAECVAETAGEGAFWKFANLMFTNEPVNPTKFGQFAQEAGADPSKVASCMINGTPDERITASRQNALAMGAQETPYAVIVADGAPPVVVNGAYPYAYIKQQIDAALAIASSTDNGK